MSMFTDINLINDIKIMNDEVHIDKRGYFTAIPIARTSNHVTQQAMPTL